MFWVDLGKGVSVREDNTKGQAERQVKILFQDEGQRTHSLTLDEVQIRNLVQWLVLWLSEE
jgi:hypothetical protein